MSKVSVVIPCYNLGKYINEAINSVLNQTYQNFEIIVINDGSSEEETIKILNLLDKSKLKIINTINQGPSKARNIGIEASTGEYILPLDADDKISPTYMERAVNILNQNKNTGIVYCKAAFFGEENIDWDLPDYKLSRILIDNLIFCSAFFRRSDWKFVKGYKTNMVHGWEDYDFWLSIIELNRDIYCIPETLFYYRIRDNSRTKIIKKEQVFELYKQIVNNHPQLYLNNVEFIFEYIYTLRESISNLQQTIIEKDTNIHHLNLEKLELNKEINDLSSKYSSIRILAKSLIKQVIKRFSN